MLGISAVTERNGLKKALGDRELLVAKDLRNGSLFIICKNG